MEFAFLKFTMAGFSRWRFYSYKPNGINLRALFTEKLIGTVIEIEIENNGDPKMFDPDFDFDCDCDCDPDFDKNI